MSVRHLESTEQLLGDLVGAVAQGSETSIPWQLPGEAPRSGSFILRLPDLLSHPRYRILCNGLPLSICVTPTQRRCVVERGRLSIRGNGVTRNGKDSSPPDTFSCGSSWNFKMQPYLVSINKLRVGFVERKQAPCVSNYTSSACVNNILHLGDM